MVGREDEERSHGSTRELASDGVRRGRLPVPGPGAAGLAVHEPGRTGARAPELSAAGRSALEWFLGRDQPWEQESWC